MEIKGKPAITKLKGGPWTRVTFWPDLERFGMTSFDDDFIALVTRRVYDIAGILKGVKVYLNDKRLPVKSFKSYVKMALTGRLVLFCLNVFSSNLVVSTTTPSFTPRSETVGRLLSPSATVAVFSRYSFAVIFKGCLHGPDELRQCHCHHQGRQAR